VDNLQHIINGLRPNEVQFIRDFYRVKFKNSKNKRLRLFELLVDKEVTCSSQASKRLYNCKSHSAFSHLKKRLEEDILNFMILLSSDDPGLIESSGKEIKCRKTLLQGKILLARGMQNNGLSLMQKTSKMAEQYEFPDLNLAACDMLRRYEGISKQKYYSDSIQKAFKIFSKILKAKEINCRFNNPAPENNDAATDNYSSLPNWNAKFQPEQSKRAYFWYEMALIDHNIQEKEYELANEQAQQLIAYLDLERALNCTLKKAQVLLKLSETEIQLGRYHLALHPARLARQLQEQNNLIFTRAVQLEFNAGFNAGEFDMAEQTLSLMQSQKHDSSDLPWNVLKAALYFARGRYDLVGKTLHQTNYKREHKANIGLSVGLLELLNILEMQDYDWFEYKMDSFRKKLKKVKTIICPRLPEIYGLMRSLVKCNYNYKNTVSHQQSHLAELTSYHWDPLGYELINVADWIKSKTV